MARCTSFNNPNFAAMAEAAGVRGIRLEAPGEVDRDKPRRSPMTGWASSTPAGCCLLPIPPSITVEMAKGFSL
jgi:pyruvate dehydrogenase (quinone)